MRQKRRTFWYFFVRKSMRSNRFLHTPGWTLLILRINSPFPQEWHYNKEYLWYKKKSSPSITEPKNLDSPTQSRDLHLPMELSRLEISRRWSRRSSQRKIFLPSSSACRIISMERCHDMVSESNHSGRSSRKNPDFPSIFKTNASPRASLASPSRRMASMEISMQKVRGGY